MGEGRMSRGWRLACESWNVIQRDRTLLLFPLLSALSTLLAGAAIFGPGIYYTVHDRSHMPILVAGAVAAYPLTFISTFFGVAFLTVARRRLSGEEASVRSGLAAARDRIGPIAAWALVMTLFGVVLQVLRRLPFADHMAGIVGAIIALVLQVGWSLATFFVHPAIAIDDVGPREAMRRSLNTFRKRWGESVTGGVVIGASFGILVIPIAIIGIIGASVFRDSPGAGAVVLAVAAGLFLLWSAAESAVTRLFSLALYEFANDRDPVSPYDVSDLEAAFKERKSLLRRWRDR